MQHLFQFCWFWKVYFNFQSLNYTDDLNKKGAQTALPYRFTNQLLFAYAYFVLHHLFVATDV